MAKGRKCRICGSDMWAEVEDNQAEGRWVRYACLNKKKPCYEKEKVFERYPK